MINQSKNQSLTPMKVIDVFCGVGGLSIGAARAGFELIAGIDIDKHMIVSFKKNFPNTIDISEDVSRITGKNLIRLAELEEGELTGLIGGPPCQGFSRIFVLRTQE